VSRIRLSSSEDLASGTFLSLFAFYLILHIGLAWPHISASLRGAL
jgi:hypothetical protein